MFIFISIQTPQQLCPPSVISSLEEHYFQKTLFVETAVGDFAISLDRVIMCEPVRVETVRRNF